MLKIILGQKKNYKGRKRETMGKLTKVTQEADGLNHAGMFGEGRERFPWRKVGGRVTGSGESSVTQAFPE